MTETFGAHGKSVVDRFGRVAAILACCAAGFAALYFGFLYFVAGR